MSLKEQEYLDACQLGDLNKVKQLSNETINLNCGHPSGFQLACQKGNKRIVEYLITFPTINVNQLDELRRSPLYFACLTGNEEIAKILLNSERTDVNRGDIAGRTPLYIACMTGREEMVKILLASGREIDVTKKANRSHALNYMKYSTPSEIAREHGLIELADLVDEYERNPKIVRMRMRNELSK